MDGDMCPEKGMERKIAKGVSWESTTKQASTKKEFPRSPIWYAFRWIIMRHIADAIILSQKRITFTRATTCVSGGIIKANACYLP